MTMRTVDANGDHTQHSERNLKEPILLVSLRGWHLKRVCVWRYMCLLLYRRLHKGTQRPLHP